MNEQFLTSICKKISTDGGVDVLFSPNRFVDSSGNSIHIEDYCGGTPEEVFEALVKMYVVFQPSVHAQEIPPQNKEEINKWLSDIVQEVGVVAWHGNQIVGHAMLIPVEDDHELGIYVHHQYQHEGIGTQLMRVLLGSAQSHGISSMWLTVEDWNEVAIRLYRQMGFEETGFKQVYGKNQQSSIKRMRRKVEDNQ